jgi:hypothetical protein
MHYLSTVVRTCVVCSGDQLCVRFIVLVTVPLQRLCTKPLSANTRTYQLFSLSDSIVPCLMAIIIIVCRSNEVLNATNARVCAQFGAIFGGNWTIESCRGFVVQLQSISLSPHVHIPQGHKTTWVVCCLYDVRTCVRSFYYRNSICCSLRPFDVTFMGLSDSFVFAEKGPRRMHFYRICLAPYP